MLDQLHFADLDLDFQGQHTITASFKQTQYCRESVQSGGRRASWRGNSVLGGWGGGGVGGHRVKVLGGGGTGQVS